MVASDLDSITIDGTNVGLCIVVMFQESIQFLEGYAVMFQESIQFLEGYAEEWKLLSVLEVCRPTKSIGNTSTYIPPCIMSMISIFLATLRGSTATDIR
jgi:hypothetical protein